MAENLEFNTDIKVEADTSEAKKSIDSISESVNKLSDDISKVSEFVNFDKAVKSSNELSNKISEIEDKFILNLIWLFFDWGLTKVRNLSSLE